MSGTGQMSSGIVKKPIEINPGLSAAPTPVNEARR